MKSRFIQFFIRLLVFSVLLGVFAFALSLILPENTLPTVLPWLFIFFIIVTSGVHAVLLKITELRPARFVSYFMLTTFGKLVLYFIAVLVYVFTHRAGLLPFILSFFILYILYTIFEVVLILAQTRATENGQND